MCEGRRREEGRTGGRSGAALKIKTPHANVGNKTTKNAVFLQGFCALRQKPLQIARFLKVRWPKTL